MNVIHRGKLRHVEFTLASGDIFDASVDAIVNSEQTDFVLSRNPASLSGQIWNRYGRDVQQELDALTQGQVLGPGTVIDTSGGQDFKRVFHAGFHDPDDWFVSAAGLPNTGNMVDQPHELRETDYFVAIGSCMAQILDSAVAQKLASVAFPLIGCGRFGLDEKMLILQFLDSIEEFDDRLPDGKSLQVWLVIRDRVQLESAAGTFLDLLMQARRKLVSVQVEQTGVSVLDRFASRLLDHANEEWAKWQLCRYAEIATEIMCYGIGRAAQPTTTPETLFEEGRAPTFGHFLESAKHLAGTANLDNSAWGAHFFSCVLKDVGASGRALAEINHQRNNLAHGRRSLPLAQIKKLLTDGLQLELWERIPETDGELHLTDWRPWVRIPPTETNQIGLFERWQKKSLRYLVPETGEVFDVPRRSIAGSV
jgi:O-acetyl-ADP-ribose deacetylase (regulator of RNase III)